MENTSVIENVQLTEILNQQLANWNIMYTKLHNYHWYVSGKDFFTLHEKFEELYNEAAQYIDEIAERILTVDGKPLATLKEYLDKATISEATSTESSEEMVASIVKDFEIIIQDAQDVVRVAEKDDDEVTADMFIGLQASLQKHRWMLEAYLK
ncbi:Dps family protein [Aquibacillus sediminis]|uniref:Dps family protein n=1 Tax=Aquibacillus sediminis TaxID=2574734 RepID=UPI0011084DFD|nr:Dps family protein [Aquibacillus sediminis]